MLTLALLLFLNPLPAFSQSFEGVLHQRTMELEEDALFEWIYGDTENEPDFEDEAEWFRYVAARLFEIPSEDLRSADAYLTDLLVQVKGDRIRFSQEGQPIYSIHDISTQDSWIINPPTRTYVEMSREDAEAQAARMESMAEEMMAEMGIDLSDLEESEEEMYEDEGGGIDFPKKVVPLDRTDRIHGFDVTGFRAEVGNEVGIGWCALDLGALRGAMEALSDRVDSSDEDAGSAQGPVMEDLICEEGLPILTKIVRLEDWGGFTFSMTEILSVEETSLDSALFTVPAGYTKRTLAEMWR